MKITNTLPSLQLDYDKLREFCLSDIESFKAFGNVTETIDGIFISRIKPNNKVLAIAHLDSVNDSNHFHVITGHKSNKDKAMTDFILNQQLDDRLGAYVICDLLPGLGLEYDILLTEGEEQGRSTAFHFTSEKRYNWIFSFDRRGDDVVMYQYETTKYMSLLKSYGFKPGIGSFSDIAFLDHLNCTGFNFGVGYYDEHHPLSYMDTGITLSQVKMFINFFNKQKNNYMRHDGHHAAYHHPLSRITQDFGKFWNSLPSTHYKSSSRHSDESLIKYTCEVCETPLTDPDDISYGTCEECFVDCQLRCDTCDTRISISDLNNYGGLCKSCDSKWFNGESS